MREDHRAILLHGQWLLCRRGGQSQTIDVCLQAMQCPGGEWIMRYRWRRQAPHSAIAGCERLRQFVILAEGCRVAFLRYCGRNP